MRDHRHTSIISHEILATASRSQVGRALTSLGHDDGAEIHVVLSVRDLVRQIPAEWQENVKHRSGIAYGAFLDQIRDPERESRIATWFWGVQEIPDILDRWGHDLPPERIHLVTVPPAGGAPELLWKRFSQVFGLDGLDLDLEPERANPSLGVPETALIRRINRAANRDLAPADYRPLVRELLAHQTLSRRRGSPRLALPPDAYPWVARPPAGVGRRDRRARVRRRRRPRRPARPAARRAGPTPTSRRRSRSPAPPSTRSRRCCWRTPGCGAPRSASAPSSPRPSAALERSYLRPTYRFREKVVRRLQGGRLGRGMLRAYRGGARQQLAVGVAADPPGRRSRRRRRRPARRRRAPAGRRVVASRLPATRVIRSVATSAEMIRVEVGVVQRSGGQGHRRRRELAPLDQGVDRVLAEDASTRIALRTRGSSRS